MFDVNTWLSTLGTVYWGLCIGHCVLGLCFPRDADGHVNVCPISLNWDTK